jgi:hypothetical protein
VFIANGISSDCIGVAVTHKIWKELKLEIKEVKQHIKIETDGLKLVLEDLRKIKKAIGANALATRDGGR